MTGLCSNSISTIAIIILVGFLQSLDCNCTWLQETGDMEGSNQPPLGTKESAQESPSTAQWWNMTT
jgi:hypothetical protein